MNIGENIARIRKEKGITQERLGELMGVSGQAVSKWENGGAPDIALLPMLAEKLGVTIDSLFGSESRSREDMALDLTRWLQSLPTKTRIPEMFRALAGSFSALLHDVGVYAEKQDGLPMRSAWESVDGHEVYYRSYIDCEDGQALGVLAEDFPFYMLLPRPTEGHARNLASPEAYRKLFACLAKPGVIEILMLFHSRPNTSYSAGALRRLTGEDIGSEVIDSLMELELLWETTVELEQGEEKLYRFADVGGFVPLLYVARWFMDTKDQWWTTCSHFRETPLLAE